MKKLFSLTGVFAAVLLFGQTAEHGLLLHSSFDRFTTAPDYAANPDTATTGIPPELQMRMYKDPQDKLNAVMLNNREYIQYTHSGNFSPQCGTVSLWVKPVNWKMSDAHYFQTFFEVRSGDAFRLILGKALRGNALNAIMIANKKSHVASVRAEWGTGEWHKLDLVWNSQCMKLYVDGCPPERGSRGEVVFPESPGWPESIRWATMRLNYFQGWRTNPEWETAYDDLKIYNRVLTPAEILGACEKKKPSGQKVLQSFLNSPGTMPIAAPLPGNRNSMVSTSFVAVSHDREKLCLDFTVGNPGKKHDILLRDGELWRNDAVEFHIRGGDGKQRQFIVNPSGALYDALNGDPKWNSRAAARAERLGNTWKAHLEIPLADLGGGSSFPVNFGVTDTSADGNHYTWNEVSGNGGFSDPRFFGMLHLSGSSSRVDLFSLGDPTAGRLDVRAETSPGIRTETEYRMANGQTGKGGKAVLPEGKTTLVFRAFLPDGTPAALYQRSVVVNPPLTLRAAGIPQKKQIECRLDFSASGLKKGAGVLRLISENGRIVYAEKHFSADSPECTVCLPVPENLPDNASYRITAAVGPFSAETIFRIPDMRLFQSGLARDHHVPAPWIPVSVSGENIRVLDRTYTFGSGPLPSQIVSRGNPLLTAPPQFLLNGKGISWAPVRIGENHGDYVETASSGKFPGGSAEIKGKLWFDGMYQFDLQLRPDGPLAIRSLRLSWAMPRAMAEYAMATAFTPWENDRIRLKWNPMEYHSLFWLSGTESGLAWWCSSDANWIINPNQPNISAIRNASEVKVDIDIFAAPATLKKTAGYTMVFQATPPKRPDHSFREWGLGPYWFKDSDCTLVGGHSASGRDAPDNIRNWISLEPVDPVKFRARMQELHGKNLKTRLYGMPTHLTRLDPEYDWFFKSCALKPGVVWQAKDAKTGKAYLAEPCCAHTPVGDLHVGRLDRLFRNVPELDGIYFDIMHVKNCSNELHGCGVVDAFGKSCTTSIALNLRDYVLRVLKICQKHKRMFWLHAHNAFFPFVHDLADNWMPGEELFSAIEKNPEWGYLEAVTPEAYQSAWNGDVRGISISSIGQLERITRMLDLPESRKRDMRSDEYAVHALAPSVLYDFMVMALGSEHPEHPLFRLWRIRKKVKLNHADFHGYWTDPAASSAPAIKTSWYSWPEKTPQPFLLCVVNTGRETCKTDLKIDWKKLHSAPCELNDLWSRRSFSEKELAEFPLAGHNFMLLVPAKKGECRP